MKTTPLLRIFAACALSVVYGAGATAPVGAFDSGSDVVAPPKTRDALKNDALKSDAPKKGSVAFSPATGEYRVTGGGGDIWGTSDGFYYVWKKMEGDMAITADVRFDGTGAMSHRKMALMIRQSLDPDSAYADAVVHGDGLTSLQFRPAAGAASQNVVVIAKSDLSGPVHIRIERHGDQFIVQAGKPGEQPTSSAPGTIPMHGPVYVGLAVSSHNPDVLETAVFSGVAIQELHAQQDLPRPSIAGVAHIAVYAADYEKSRAFYHDFLGFEEPYSLSKPDGTPSMTFFKINERQYLELFPETAPASDRLNHISIETDNAEAMRQYLASRGIPVPKQVAKGRIGNSNFNVKDPEGHTVEIVQYEPAGWTVRERGKHLPPDRISTHMMHVGIVVTALAPEMKFYEDILGFREIWRGSSSGTQLSWVNLKVPDGDDYIEFMLFKDAPPPDRRGTAHHLALEVPDMAASVAALEARPYRKQYSRPMEPKVGVNRKRQVNLFDPDGTRIELMEPVTVDGKPVPSSQAPPPRE
jgi:catechol 2,3-dioxygenase-like lactoylglutathione lyase family enzyme